MKQSGFMFDARPHPNPLPRGEGNDGGAFSNFQSTCYSYPLTDTRVAADDSPSPRGEGRGEGGR